MPYLPPDVVNHTIMPTAQGYDLATSIRIVEEVWTRHFPKLAYYQLNRSNTPADAMNLSGDTTVPTTTFDTVWGETIDNKTQVVPTLPAGSVAPGWTQPHLNTIGLEAADPDVYFDPILIPMRVSRVNFDTDLHKYGFDKTRDLLVTVPTSILDHFGITSLAGDKVNWDGDDYVCLKNEPKGWFKNTNVYLYLQMTFTRKRKSSS